MIKHTVVLAALSSVAIVCTIGQGMAHTGASGIVLERMESMITLADHAKNVGDMLKNKTPFELQAVQDASSAFVSHGEHMPMLFPDTEESRNGAKTEALPAIWTDWEDFTRIAKQFTEDSRTMASLVEELAAGTLSPDEQSRAVRSSFFKASKGRRC